MSIVIRAEGLSKMYHIGKKRSGNFREAISGRVQRLFSKHEEDISEFWALKGVSFEAEQSEVLGIVGRNGAGKSTLLKILSRITEPTEGRIEINGRIAALLEVGTGFHPELTGRENIFMNGAILGMKQAEIKNKFDEIVSFSGIEKFIDTPVKRYSSGMYVRLAFAVAAHLEPEILIIDEVLAVGDAEFQKKCLGKMKDVSEREGRTVIFVSHNMAAIQSLCTRALLIREGRIAFNDLPAVICMKYMEENLPSDAQLSIGEMPRSSDQLSVEARIIDQQVISEGKINPAFVNPAQPFSIKLKVKVNADNLKFGVQFIVSDDHQNLIMLDSGSMQHKYFELGKGEYEIECSAAPMMLYAGSYYLQSVLNIPNHKLLDHVEQSYSFSIMSNDPYNKGFNLQKTDKFGVFHVDHQWSEAMKVN